MSIRRTTAALTPAEALARFKDGPSTGVFTDGACEGNPGPGGWAFAWVEDGRLVREGSGGDVATTNNRMELTALINAYRVAGRRHLVYSDSGFA
jgi:ribonuclease HI